MVETIKSTDYFVDRHGDTLYHDDDTTQLRWGDARGLRGCQSQRNQADSAMQIDTAQPPHAHTARSLLFENETISAAAVQQILEAVDLRALGRKIKTVLALIPPMSVAATSD